MVKRPSPRSPAVAGKPKVRFRMRVTVADVIAFGPGKVDLLEAIREHGSISAAARSLDMSYRRAWLLLQEINQSMRRPAVLSEHGGEHRGGSTLTPEGEDVIRLYRAIEAQAAAACSAEIKALLKLLA
ncbi:ModE molybdate transport repressor domain protein [compost metagenome]